MRFNFWCRNDQGWQAKSQAFLNMEPIWKYLFRFSHLYYHHHWNSRILLQGKNENLWGLTFDVIMIRDDKLNCRPRATKSCSDWRRLDSSHTTPSVKIFTIWEKLKSCVSKEITLLLSGIREMTGNNLKFRRLDIHI